LRTTKHTGVPSFNIFDHDANVRSYEPGVTLFELGQSGEEMYVVLDGEVELTRADHLLETVSRGGMFGEMALLEGEPRSTTATTKTAARLVPVTRQRFLYLVQNTPFFAIEVMQTLARRLRTTDARLDV
jgi:CRP/FNR family transcriptional regulator, cyclic AMP receptor protein